MKTLAVDGVNILLRSVFGMKGVELSSDGVNTAALVAFINQISKVVRSVEPDHMVVCWDGGNDYRKQIDREYKSNRRNTPQRDDVPFVQAKEFLTLNGIHHVSLAGVEADDIIAHYWKHRVDDFYVFSSDKDFLQLVDRDATVIRPGAMMDRWVPARVESEYGVEPDQLSKVMAIVGDKTDGVVGVAGIGYKTAAKILHRWDFDLDRALREDKRLLGHSDVVKRNMRLIDLREHAEPLHLPSVPQFTPTSNVSIMWRDLLWWLDLYKLRTVKNKLISGGLWRATPTRT